MKNNLHEEKGSILNRDRKEFLNKSHRKRLFQLFEVFIECPELGIQKEPGDVARIEDVYSSHKDRFYFIRF